MNFDLKTTHERMQPFRKALTTRQTLYALAAVIVAFIIYKQFT